MDKKQLQDILKTIFILIFGLFDILLIIRFLLKFIGAGESSSFVAAWYTISDTIYAPFLGTINNLELGKLTIEINSIIGAIIFLITGFLGFRMVGSFFADTMSAKIQQLVDTFFKMIEALLGIRLIFKLLAVGTSNFVSFLYGMSAIFSSPFQGILKEVTFRNFVFETSTFVAIILIVIIDILSDKVLAMVVKETPARIEKPTQTSVLTNFGQQNIIPRVPAQFPTHAASANISSLPLAGRTQQPTSITSNQTVNQQPINTAPPVQEVLDQTINQQSISTEPPVQEVLDQAVDQQPIDAEPPIQNIATQPIEVKQDIHDNQNTQQEKNVVEKSKNQPVTIYKAPEEDK